MNNFSRRLLTILLLLGLSLACAACSSQDDQLGVPDFRSNLEQAQLAAFSKTDSLLSAKLKAQTEAQQKAQAEESKSAQDKAQNKVQDKAKDKDEEKSKANANQAEVSQDKEDFTAEEFATLYEVNLRSGPGTDFESLDQLAANTPVTQVGPEENGWLPVLAGANRGYIRQDLLMPVSEMSAPDQMSADEPDQPAAQPVALQGIPETPVANDNQSLLSETPESNDADMVNEAEFLQATEAQTSYEPGPVIITRTGKKYHKPGCPSIAHSEGLRSVGLSEAQGLGLGPCKKCH